MSFWDKITETGLKLPYAYDPVSGKPSVTLLFPYIAFIVAIIGNIILINKDTFTGTVTAIIFWALSTVFYMLRQLNKAKIDLDDKSIDLEGESDETKS